MDAVAAGVRAAAMLPCLYRQMLGVLMYCFYTTKLLLLLLPPLNTVCLKVKSVTASLCHQANQAMSM